ncbi:DUF2238 domain-containing protein [Amycolatopsis sp. cmx-11-51]|uniref:DUF2238 domain-containing protein n=1 Tax=Amycolatopsis sp. cmx-11-51 TaxID=2785797 RepID=UPI0039E6A6CF
MGTGLAGPPIAVREVLLRRTPLRPGGWVTFLTVCVCLAIAACVEFVEWFSALAAGSARTISSPRKEMSGTRSGTWSSASAVRSFPCSSGAGFTIGTSPRVRVARVTGGTV